MPQRKIIQIAIIAGVIAIAVFIGFQVVSRNTPYNKFARSITIEHSNYSSDEFGDYGNIVIGKIGDVSFSELASILRLRSHTMKPIQDVEPDAPGWQLFPELAWWVIPNEFDEIYYDLGHGSQCLLARKGDTVYLQDLTW